MSSAVSVADTHTAESEADLRAAAVESQLKVTSLIKIVQKLQEDNNSLRKKYVELERLHDVEPEQPNERGGVFPISKRGSQCQSFFSADARRIARCTRLGT